MQNKKAAFANASAGIVEAGRRKSNFIRGLKLIEDFLLAIPL